MSDKKPIDLADALEMFAESLERTEAHRGAILAIAVKALEDIANGPEGAHAHHLRTVANGALVRIAVAATAAR